MRFGQYFKNMSDMDFLHHDFYPRNKTVYKLRLIKTFSSVSLD